MYLHCFFFLACRRKFLLSLSVFASVLLAFSFSFFAYRKHYYKWIVATFGSNNRLLSLKTFSLILSRAPNNVSCPGLYADVSFFLFPYHPIEKVYFSADLSHFRLNWFHSLFNIYSLLLSLFMLENQPSRWFLSFALSVSFSPWFGLNFIFLGRLTVSFVIVVSLFLSPFFLSVRL